MVSSIRTAAITACGRSRVGIPGQHRAHNSELKTERCIEAYILLIFNLILIANIVTTSKAPVTTSDALVTILLEHPTYLYFLPLGLFDTKS